MDYTIDCKSNHNGSGVVAYVPSPSLKRKRAPRRKKSMTLREVAAAAGVSIATVSMVVNDNPRISRATHNRVKRVCDRLGYRTSRAGQQFAAARRSKVVTVLLPPQRHAMGDAYFAELISGICDRAALVGHSVAFEQASGEFLQSRRHISMLENRECDGLLLLGFNDYHNFLDDFDQRDLPVVTVDAQLTRCNLDSVGCDYRTGAQQVMNYLTQLGHRKIALISAMPAGRSAVEVVETYRRALPETRPGEGWIADGQFTEEGGEEAAEKLLRRHDDLTAIFCASDKMAIGALHCLTRRGLCVPGDVSLVGFDNLRHAAYLNPPLTTVHLPLHSVGARAFERLVERMQGRREVIHERLTTHLILRESASMPVGTLPRAASVA